MAEREALPDDFVAAANALNEMGDMVAWQHRMFDVTPPEPTAPQLDLSIFRKDV